MRKLNLYDIDVMLVYPERRIRERHFLHVVARNLKNAESKATQVLNATPHGIPSRYWKLTGRNKCLGKVFY